MNCFFCRLWMGKWRKRTHKPFIHVLLQFHQAHFRQTSGGLHRVWEIFRHGTTVITGDVILLSGSGGGRESMRHGRLPLQLVRLVVVRHERSGRHGGSVVGAEDGRRAAAATTTGGMVMGEGGAVAAQAGVGGAAVELGQHRERLRRQRALPHFRTVHFVGNHVVGLHHGLQITEREKNTYILYIKSAKSGPGKSIWAKSSKKDFSWNTSTKKTQENHQEFRFITLSVSNFLGEERNHNEEDQMKSNQND